MFVVNKPQAAIQAPVRFITAPNPESATQPPKIYEQAYGVANINRPSQLRQHGRPGRRRLTPCCCWTMIIVAIVVGILAAIAIVVPLVLTRETSEMALEIEATKMSVPYFVETDRGAFRYYEQSFCSDINTIVDNSYVEASVEFCELKEVEKYRPPIATETFNITGTTFRVFVVFTSGESRPEFALNTIIDLLVQGAYEGTYRGHHLSCFSQIDKLYFPGSRDEPIFFRKDYCFNVELTNKTLEHNPKLSVDDTAKFKEYESALCYDVKRLFKLPEISSSVYIDYCSLNGTESYIENGLWPPATTFLLWIQIRRIDVINEASLLLRVNQLLGKALLYNNIAHRAAFTGITSGQIIKCRKQKPPITTIPGPTTAEAECNDTEITVPVTEIIGVFRTNLDIDTDGYGGSPSSADVEEKIKEIAYVKDIFEKCEAELNCLHPPVTYINSLGDPLGKELKFSIKITVVISAKESPSEVAVIAASNDPKGYTRSVNQATITVSSCDIVSCETYHGGCAHACSTHECNQLIGDRFTCSCPYDQVAVGEDCVDITDAFPCFFGDDSCLFEITSGQAVNIGGLILPDQETDEELVLSLDVTITKPVCLAITYVFDTTCPEDNWIALENCRGYQYWNATYGLGTLPDFVEIPKGATNLIFRLRSRGPFIGLMSVLVTEGPCRRVRLVGGNTAKEGVLEWYADNTWHPVCNAGDDLRAFLPNLCSHLGFDGKWEVILPVEQFGERPPSDTYVDSLTCIIGTNQCSTQYPVTCKPNIVDSCPAGLQALRCATMAEEPIHQVRFLEGFDHMDGRVEVFYKGRWTSLASDDYNALGSLTAATGAICRTLGYAPAFFYPSSMLPGYSFSIQDTSLIEYWEVRPPVTHSIQCLCGAQDFTACQIREVNPLDSFDPLTVWCNPPITPPTQQQLSEDEITLVGSSGSLTAGRVELEVGGVIGTVCYSERIIAFPEESQAVADVICRTLGHETPGLLVMSQWGFGTRSGSAPNFLEDLRCEGDEAHINECTCAFVATSECSRKEDAALACGDAAIDTVLNQVEVQLYNERQTNDGVIGLVEVQLKHFNGTATGWGTVCDDGIEYGDVGVICNMLGYMGGGEQVRNSYCGQGRGPIHVDNLNCPLNAMAITQCIASPWGVTNCRHHEDLCITCTNEPISVRLERDPPFLPFIESGLVVVRYGGRDGLITTDTLDTTISRDTTDFLCSKTLGWPIAEVAFSSGNYTMHPEGETKYRARLINNLQCTREDTNITDCQHDGWGAPPSNPDNTLHLFCHKNIPNPQPRIIGPRDGAGNVQVQVGTENGVMCYEDPDRFTATEAKRICQDLGWSYGKVMMGTRVYKVALLEGADCAGNPSNFSSCDYRLSEHKPYCDAENTAAVFCYNDESSTVSVTMKDGAVMVDTNGRSKGAVCKCQNDGDGKHVVRHLCGAKQGMIVDAAPQSRDTGLGCRTSLDNLICVGENCILKSPGVGEGKCKQVRVICAGDGPRNSGNDEPETPIPSPSRDNGPPTASRDIYTANITCEFDGDCDPGEFLNVAGTLTATNTTAILEFNYILPYETCACVNVSKADKGSLLIVQARTLSYINLFIKQMFASFGESAAIHGEPTVDYEQVCTTVWSFDRPVINTYGTQAVQIIAIPVSNGVITIEDLKLYNGTCESLSMPPVAPGRSKCRANNQFVDDSSLCDGVRDCWDGSDEANCPGGFEVDFGDWQEVSQQGVKWERWAGSTLSQYTGPDCSLANTVHPFAFVFFALPELFSGKLFDSTPGTYLVMQAFRGNPGDQAVIQYDAPADTEQGCLSFVYSLIGNSIAQLRVEIVTSDSNGIGRLVWKKVGASARTIDDPYYQWTATSVNLEANPGSHITQVHIIAVRGLSESSDIAIDNVKFNTNSRCDPRSCSSIDFQCNDGTCLPMANAFDMDAQCPDESDLPSTTSAPSYCLPSEYACQNGKCLPSTNECDLFSDCAFGEDESQCDPVLTGNCDDAHNLCDGKRHCPDGHDEDGCDYDPLGETGPRCNANQYQLWCGQCVPWTQRCDGTIQAYDLSDEHNCTCPETSWNGKCGPYCIDDSWICDGVHHCPDDEMPGCENTSTNFLCDGDSLLIVGSWYCDFYPDCADGSDEPPNCRCGFDRFYYECGDGCVPTFNLCDGVQNCVDNSDEENCTGICSGGSCDCNPGNVACADSTKCISIASWCDGATDCDDCSDEAACMSYKCNPHYQFTCNDGTCIAVSAQNDLVPNCPDGEDEEIPQTYKMCANKARYIPVYSECNGHLNCDDGSDEAYCSCTSSQFRCQNGLCINGAFRCNGFNDCSDLSDERGCPANLGVCLPFQWRCNNPDYTVTTCIPENNVCNRDHDCRDQTDELRCIYDYQKPADQCDLETTDRCDGVEQCEDHPTNTDETHCLDIADDGIVLLNGLPVCAENWDKYWMFHTCTENGYGWYGAVTDFVPIGSSGYGEFYEVPLSMGQPNPTRLSNGAQRTFGCASDPKLPRVTCPLANCGFRSTSNGGQWEATNQIINGQIARNKEVPWGVVLFDNRRFICTGSILNQCWVMTAAHCVLGGVASKMEIGIGINLNTGTHYKVARFIMHPKYDEFNIVNVDLALIQLSECLTFDSQVSPLCLPHPGQEFVGEYCESAGYGKVGGVGPATDHLMVMKTNILNDTYCHENPAIRILYNDSVSVCHGDQDGWGLICFGDSGGPTYCSSKKNPQQFFLVGVHSYGPYNCNGVGVSARVTTEVDWIIDQMERYQCTCAEGCDPWSFYPPP